MYICTSPPSIAAPAGAPPFVRNVHHLQTGHVVQQLAGQMRDGPVATGAELELTGVCLHVRDQLLQVDYRHGHVDHDELRGSSHEADRSEIPVRVERQALYALGTIVSVVLLMSSV